MTASFLRVRANFFTPNSNKRHSICIALRKFPSPHTGVKIAELLQRIVAEWEIPCNKQFRVFTDNGSDKVAAFKENDNEDDIAESDGDESDTNSVTSEENEELFPDQEDKLDKMEEGLFLMQITLIYVRKITKMHLSVGSVQVALYIRCNWL